MPIADCRLAICLTPTQPLSLEIGNWQLEIGNVLAVAPDHDQRQIINQLVSCSEVLDSSQN